MPAIEIHPRQRERIAVAATKRVGVVVAGGTRRVSNTRVMLAVWIRKRGTVHAELVFDLCLRLRQLDVELRVGQLREVRVSHTVRPDLHAAVPLLANLVPGHRCQLPLVVAGKLGDREWSAFARVPRTNEDLNGNPKLLESGKGTCGAPECVVERRTDAPESREGPHLPDQEIRLDRKPVLPGLRDGVVAEDEGPTETGRHRPQIIQPTKIPKDTAAPNITTVPKMSGTYGVSFDRSGGSAIRQPLSRGS